MLAVDVVVVGAGPAGVAASVELARAGREVLLVDKACFPRDKCCGDGLTTAALRHLEALGLSVASMPSWQVVDDVVLHDPVGRVVALPLPRARGAFAAVVPRLELDAALVDLARAAGVKVADGHACTAAVVGTDRITLEVSGMSPVAARYAIGADGMWSPLRKHLGATDPARPDPKGRPGRLGQWHAFRQYFCNVGPAASGALHVWFEPDLLPGYVWSFPLPGGRANVGFGIERGRLPTRAMKALWPELLARPHISAVLGPDVLAESPHRAWPIPSRIHDMALTAAGGRALFVGDAAAACDPLTGEGIAQALVTGSLAAEAVLGAGPFDPAGAARRYRASVSRDLLADMAVSRGMAVALRHRKGVRIGLRLAGANAWTRRHFARWLFEDYPRAILATPGRWREHSLVGDGAFAPASTSTTTTTGKTCRCPWTVRSSGG
ncbi:MAG: NAD(P)/FAD-dependent oxidoreductase [Acidimicrobiales bacterium]